jgi:hypothetical protein
VPTADPVRPAEIGDGAAPALQQVGDGAPGRRPLLVDDGGDAVAVQALADRDHRHAALLQLAQLRPDGGHRDDVGGGQRHPAQAHGGGGLQDGAQPLGRMVEVVEHEVEADGAERRLHMLGQGGIDVLLDVADEQADGVAAAAAQALGHAVGLEVELAHGGQHALARGLADVALAAQHAGDGGRGHARQARHVQDGGHGDSLGSSNLGRGF